jgi:polygalacturonase
MGFRRAAALLLLLLSTCIVAQAQDTRTVNEPRIPPTCQVLTASLTAHNGTLPDGIERHYRDNDRVEAAMAACAPGHAVVLRAGNKGHAIFLIAPLHLHAGVTLVLDPNIAVWGSRDPRAYDVAPGSCGIVGERGKGCLPLILAENAPHSGIMGAGVIDGRGGARLLAPNGAVTESWWELAHRAKVEDSNQAVSRILVVRHSDDFTLYGVTLRNSPNCHVSVEATNGFTAWGVKVDTPKWARNTDGIDPQAGSSNISIVDSYIRSGDDNISPKSNASGSVHNMTVRDTHFYNGHGMSIGSQTSGGISAIRVDNLTIDGADNGLRIKSDRSRGGLVDDVQFTNICMRGVANPIVLNPFYTTFDGTKIPVYKRILLKNVHSLSSGPITLAGLDDTHRLDATLDNVVVDGERATEIAARHADLTIRRGNLEPTGEDLHITGSAGPGTPYSCENKFVPFPENSTAPVASILIPPPDKTFYVAADGTGDFYSIQAAVNRVPASGGLILVAPGTYREHVAITQSHVTLKSANPDPTKTIIVEDTSKGTQGSLPSFATVHVTGDDFTAENITFQNDFNRTHKQENQGSQAQALNLEGDRNILRNVDILGNQDTLYIGAKGCGQSSGPTCTTTRTYITHSFISGNVDFIYGDGVAFFEDSEIHSTEHAQGGMLTAQGKHYPAQDSLFVFDHCRLTADPGVANVYLGRPWRDFSTVIFLHTYMGAHIVPAGWREWHPGETHRLETATYRIFQSTGPGASPSQGNQLTPQEAARYSIKEVLGGSDHWNPAR